MTDLQPNGKPRSQKRQRPVTVSTRLTEEEMYNLRCVTEGQCVSISEYLHKLILEALLEESS